MNPLYCRLTCGPAKHKKIISAFMIAVPFLELCEVSSCCFGKSVNDCQSSFLNKLTHCANWHSATCDSSAWLPFIIVIISWHVDVCGVFSVCFVLNFAQSVQPVRSVPPSLHRLASLFVWTPLGCRETHFVSHDKTGEFKKKKKENPPF